MGGWEVLNNLSYVPGDRKESLGCCGHACPGKKTKASGADPATVGRKPRQHNGAGGPKVQPSSEPLACKGSLIWQPMSRSFQSGLFRKVSLLPGFDYQREAWTSSEKPASLIWFPSSKRGTASCTQQKPQSVLAHLNQRNRFFPLCLLAYIYIYLFLFLCFSFLF